MFSDSFLIGALKQLETIESLQLQYCHIMCAFPPSGIRISLEEWESVRRVFIIKNQLKDIECDLCSSTKLGCSFLVCMFLCVC